MLETKAHFHGKKLILYIAGWYRPKRNYMIGRDRYWFVLPYLVYAIPRPKESIYLLCVYFVYINNTKCMFGLIGSLLKVILSLFGIVSIFNFCLGIFRELIIF